jgi:hypothetical protein
MNNKEAKRGGFSRTIYGYVGNETWSIQGISVFSRDYPHVSVATKPTENPNVEGEWCPAVLRQRYAVWFWRPGDKPVLLPKEKVETSFDMESGGPLEKPEVQSFSEQWIRYGIEGLRDPPHGEEHSGGWWPLGSLVGVVGKEEAIKERILVWSRTYEKDVRERAPTNLTTAWLNDFRRIASGYGKIVVVLYEHDVGEHVSFSGPVTDGRICMGQFADNEHRMLSFFCALGGLTREHDKRLSQQPKLREVQYFKPLFDDWKAGLRLAEKHGYKITPTAAAWALEQVWGLVEGLDNEFAASERYQARNRPTYANHTADSVEVERTAFDRKSRVESVVRRGLHFELHLVGGCVVDVPRERLTPKLREATGAQVKNYRLIGGGLGIHWPDLDEDLSVEGLLAPRQEPK